MKKISDWPFFWFFLTVALGFVAIMLEDWYRALYAILFIMCFYEFVVTLMNR